MGCGCGGKKKQQQTRSMLPTRVVPAQLPRPVQNRANFAPQAGVPTNPSPDSNQFSRDRREIERKRRIAIQQALGRIM